MVRRCVCFSKTFVELKKISAKKHARSIEELQQHVRFGLNCKMCHPYVKLMLATGKTEFDVIDPASISES